MHQMPTIVTDVRCVRLSVCLSITLHNSEAARAACAGSFGAAFAKLLRPLVSSVVIAGNVLAFRSIVYFTTC